jgi:glucose-6-phosphate-specific signal transduction histidine kinase
MLTPVLRRRGGDPWFRQRPLLVLAVAGVLYLAVFVLRIFAGDAEDAYSMLYVFPVALVATAFGARPGTLAGLLAVVLMVVWAVVRDVSLDPTGWLSRIVPVLLLGVLLGSAADRERRAEDERRRLEAAALLHREAI